MWICILKLSSWCDWFETEIGCLLCSDSAEWDLFENATFVHLCWFGSNLNANVAWCPNLWIDDRKKHCFVLLSFISVVQFFCWKLPDYIVLEVLKVSVFWPLSSSPQWVAAAGAVLGIHCSGQERAKQALSFVLLAGAGSYLVPPVLLTH